MNMEIRKITTDDATQMLEYIIEVSKSAPYILREQSEFENLSVDAEKKWIESFLSNQERNILLVAINNGRIIGSAECVGQDAKRIRHVGEIGLSVHPDFRGQGIGKQLMVEIEKWAKENACIENLQLEVMPENTPALKLYKSMNYIEQGRKIKAIKFSDGCYSDLVLMYKLLL